MKSADTSSSTGQHKENTSYTMRHVSTEPHDNLKLPLNQPDTEGDRGDGGRRASPGVTMISPRDRLVQVLSFKVRDESHS